MENMRVFLESNFMAMEYVVLKFSLLIVAIFRFFVVFLAMKGFVVIAEKYNWQSKLLVYGSSKKRKTRFFYNLSQCEFCLEHHYAIIPLVIFDLSHNFHWSHIFIPFIVSSLSQYLKTTKYGSNLQ